MTISRRYRLSGQGPALAPRITKVETEGDPTPDDIDHAVRAAWREVVGREAKSTDAERQARLAAFAAEHGSGVKAHERWNRENPDDRYSDRRGFFKAVERAFDSPERRMAKLVRARVREARELGEAKATIPMSELLDAARRARTTPRYP